jgi:MoaA/NifB/PqqE/SkfB family radical SAM enzyme
MIKYPSKTWCTYPFTSLVLHNSGSYSPCCTANESVSVDLHDKEFVMKMFDPTNVGPWKPFGMTVKEAFHSEFMKDIRQKMMNGEKPTACNSCWKDENNGIKSKRQGMNQVYLESQHSPFDGGMDYDIDEMIRKPQIRSLDLKFDNKCNLHCLMCNSGSANLWVPLNKKMNKTLALQNVNLEDEQEVDLYMDSGHRISWEPGPFPTPIFEEIKSLVPQLEEIQCTGGEPFINVHFIELLKYIIETGHANHISLEITTNGTKFVTEVMELLTHFRHIRFLVSIDGTKGTYDYIRAPYRYDLLLKRLKTLDKYFVSGKIKGYADINVVGMAYNIFDYENLLTTVDDLKYEHFKVSNTNFTVYNMDNPLHIKWLPDELISEAIDYYKSLPSSPYLLSVIEKFEGYVKDYPVDAEVKLHNQRRLKNYTVLMDKTLNRDYHDYLDSRICEFLDTIDGDIK